MNSTNANVQEFLDKAKTFYQAMNRNLITREVASEKVKQLYTDLWKKDPVGFIELVKEL